MRRVIIVRGCRHSDRDDYIEAHGRHFDEALCAWASGRMTVAGGRTVPGLHTRASLDKLYERTGVRPTREAGHDDVYVANMCLADLWGGSIQDERHLAMYVRDVIDDPDAYEGIVLSRFEADCEATGVEIPWGEAM